MYKNYFTLFIFFLGFSIASAQEFPEKSKRLVNDYTNTLSLDQVKSLEKKLVTYNKETSSEVAIVMINSLEGYDVSDYAVRLAENWGIGKRDKDNGVLILVAMQEHKITIQTGYGMEGVLPDAICRRIIEQEMKPSFKENDYYEGLNNATSAIFKFAAGEYTNDNYTGKKRWSVLYLAIILVVIIFALIMGRFRRRYQYINGKRRGTTWLFGGGSGGGSWGSFSSGSGGFGGFGGGSFGGGGASGSW